MESSNNSTNSVNVSNENQSILSPNKIIQEIQQEPDNLQSHENIFGQQSPRLELPTLFAQQLPQNSPRSTGFIGPLNQNEQQASRSIPQNNPLNVGFIGPLNYNDSIQQNQQNQQSTTTQHNGQSNSSNQYRRFQQILELMNVIDMFESVRVQMTQRQQQLTQLQQQLARQAQMQQGQIGEQNQQLQQDPSSQQQPQQVPQSQQQVSSESSQQESLNQQQSESNLEQHLNQQNIPQEQQQQSSQSNSESEQNQSQQQQSHQPTFQFIIVDHFIRDNFNMVIQIRNAILIPGEAERQGTPQKDLDSLEKLVVNEEFLLNLKENDKSTSCSICLQDYAQGESICKMKCQHIFHENCLIKWLNQVNSCPYCKRKCNGEAN